MKDLLAARDRIKKKPKKKKDSRFQGSYTVSVADSEWLRILLLINDSSFNQYALACNTRNAPERDHHTNYF